MLKNSFGIKYFLAALAFLLVVPVFVPIKAWGGFEVTNIDNSVNQVFAFWDLRGRESFFQVTNVGLNPVQVHIQVFNTVTNCKEFDYFDSFTPNDTHLYNVRKLDANDLSLKNPPNLDNGFGFVVVTVVAPSPDAPENDTLIGNFRIIDGSGYEYRSNMASNSGPIDNTFNQWTFNFNDVGGAIFSDVVGIVATTELGDGKTEAPENSVLADLSISDTFDTVTLYDDAEHPRSCGPVTFACATDLGINDALPNSKGGANLCLGTDPNGFVKLNDLHDNFSGLTPPNNREGIFIGFIGLNDGAGHGSMDAWWENGEQNGLFLSVGD